MIEWFFYVAWFLWAALALASLANAALFARSRRRQDEGWAAGLEPENQRPAAVVVAIKGFDPGNTPRFFEALRRQRYRRYRLIFAMESEGDPASRWIREQLGLGEGQAAWESGRAEGLSGIALVHAGNSSVQGQKVHNQIAAFRQLNEEDAVVAFADGDIQCGEDWLARLLAPVNLGAAHASSTYRYLVPARPTFVNRLASVINASVATLGGDERWNSMWGGSMAIAREDFDALEVPRLFAGCLNDDLRLGKAVRHSGRRVAFVRSLLMPSPVDFTWSSFFEFGRRQYVQVRFVAPKFYKLSHFFTWTYVLGSSTAAWAAVQGSREAWLFLGLVFLCDQGRAVFRRRAVISLFDAPTVGALRGTFWIEHLLTPFWMLVHACLTTSALFTDCIRWAGIRYRVLAENRTEVLDRG